LDMTLEYQKDGKRVYEHFATGKTLGESGDDLDRMNLIASAVTKVFHEDGVHARYVMVGGAPAPQGVILHLSPVERDVVASFLTQMRAVHRTEYSDFVIAGQILKRIGGVVAGQEQTTEATQGQGILFSRVQLTADSGLETDIYMSGFPETREALENHSQFIDFVEFLSAVEAEPKEITAIIITFTEGGGILRDASQADIDRINKATAELGPECDVQIAFGWHMGESQTFTFSYDADEMLGQGMGGIE